MALKNRRFLALSDEILMSVEKPARYTGNEINMVKKDPASVDVRFCMCFPDVYEIGMSHLGIQILYDMFNQWEDTYCERVYSPWPDLDKIMREKKIPLFALESQQPIKNFDFLGITLQYEMCYTNILQVLDLSGIPLYTKDRTMEDPFVICGGPCTYNPEPIADFFDLVYIGEGETSYRELLDKYKEWKKSGKSRREFLEIAATVDGIYVPSLYDVTYNQDGTIHAMVPNCETAPEKVKKQVVNDLTHTYYPEKPLVPYIKATQDRVVLEIQRGCIRGCRFCQAGMIYRPIRPRDIDYLKKMAVTMLDNTGYEEITLSSLSSSDYKELSELVYFLIDECDERKINISLPSLRIDAFSLDVMSKVQDVKKSSLTFAPEAGSQRMRNVINKGLTEEVILSGAWEAFQGGWNRVKLYFMLGLPGEREDDIEQIAVLADKIAAKYFELPKEERHGRPEIVASSSFFVPKPFTPFQWSPMNTAEQFESKRRFLLGKVKEQLNQRSIRYQCHDAVTSELEGIFARGDRKLCKVIEDAYRRGCIFDAWTDYFREDVWEQVMDENGVSRYFYNYRERDKDEIFPWDFIDIGVSKNFLYREYENSIQEKVTPNCRAKCSGCGAAKFGSGVCMEWRQA
ncbi:MAG TPA: TIGR03960 family B12-binding radical SAM protein [Lachnospiraceae bacterium]|nr:TIGR03960 family B12-binding radical SAM protein [Lachnospiraceae bacterium]